MVSPGPLVALAAAACAATAAAASALDRPPPGDVRTCATRGESTHPVKPPPGAIRVGPLVIWPTIRSQTQPTIDPAWPYSTKAPVLVRARARVTLAIASEAAGVAGLWRNRGGYVSAVRFAACREREPSHVYNGTVGRFTAFPFSFALTVRSACVPMEVWVDGESDPHRLVVPVGRNAC